MKYFEISTSSGFLSKEGNKLAMPRVRIKYQSDTKDVLEKIRNLDDPIHVKVLEYLTLWSFEKEEYWELILPDFLNFSPPIMNYSVVISQRLYTALVDFGAIEHLYIYSANLIFKGEIAPFYMVVFSLESIDDVVDFDASTYAIVDRKSGIVEQDYLETINSLGNFIEHKKLFRKKNELLDLQIVHTVMKDNIHFIEYLGTSRWIVSEPFYNYLLTQDLRGIEFMEFNRTS